MFSACVSAESCSPWPSDQSDGVRSEPHLRRGHLVFAAAHQRPHHKVCSQDEKCSLARERPHYGGQRRGNHDCSSASLQRTEPRCRSVTIIL